MKNSIIPYTLLLLVVVLLAIQLIHPQKNLSDNNIHHISKVYAVPASVSKILKTSCNDCHSNFTEYPWYSSIQPVDWWLQHHVNEGKRELNFSEFATYRIFKQYHKLEETIEMVQEDEMPLSSYTLIHTNAKLSTEQKAILKNWASAILDSMKASYPPDSLVNPFKRLQ